jgi:hypothetical protein
MKNLIAFVLVGATPLIGQSFEVGAFVGQQKYRVTESIPPPSPQNPLVRSTDSNTVEQVRFGYSFLNTGVTKFKLIAAYQPASNATVHITAPNNRDPYPQNLGTTTLNTQSWAAGIAIAFQIPIELEIGLEARSEKIKYGNIGGYTYNRPWARANVGYSFQSFGVKPFICFEIAAPLISTSSTYSNYNSGVYEDPEVSTKALAPKLQVGLYAGIRF